MDHAVIIDSFWSHNSIAYLCKSTNVNPIHIYSSANVYANHPGRNTVAKDYFSDSWVYEDDLDDLLIKLQSKKIKFVFGCSDSSQYLAHRLSQSLGLHINNECFNARQNKFCLYQKLGQPASNLNFAEFASRYETCIIKPAPIELSSGCAGVRMVTKSTAGLKDIENYFISPFFPGKEYAIDFVSFNGKHKVTGVWEYVSQDHTDWWKDKVALLDYLENQELIKRMYSAATTWLDAISHKFGPTHIELRYDGCNFYCVEINFRLHGHLPLPALKKSLTITQPELTFDALMMRFPETIELNSYHNIGHTSRLYYINSRYRNESEIPWTEIESMESVIRVWKHARPNEDLKPGLEKSTKGCLAVVVLTAASKNKLEEAERQVLSLLD